MVYGVIIQDNIMAETWWLEKNAFVDKYKAEKYGEMAVKKANKEYEPIEFEYRVVKLNLIE